MNLNLSISTTSLLLSTQSLSPGDGRQPPDHKVSRTAAPVLRRRWSTAATQGNSVPQQTSTDTTSDTTGNALVSPLEPKCMMHY